MKQVINNEDGVSLVELVAGVALLSLILIPLSLMVSVSSKSASIQKEKADIQQLTNLMVAQLIDISERPDLYQRAGYSDKETIDWDKNHIIQVDGNGSRKVQITDILDTKKERAKTYEINQKDVSIHIEQEKNKHAKRRTKQYLANSRDSFTIQETVVIRFEKLGEELYSQEVELDYRDEKKARGDIGGEGWW